MVKLRRAVPEDAPRLVEIYGYYVEKTAISFEYTVPSPEEFRGRMERIMRRYPYLVAEVDGRVAGYAYAGACELTIYLDPEARKRGLGRALYEAMEKALGAMGVLNLYACIGYPRDGDDEYLSSNSADFHAHLGFEKIGTFTACGYKFGRWYDMIWMEKIIGQHRAGQANIVPFTDVKMDFT